MQFLSKMFDNWIYVSCISSVTTLIWLYYCEKKESKYTKVVFYDPLDNIYCETCKYYFDIDCTIFNCSSVKTKNIINCLQNSRKSINICLFAISNEPIANAIISAHRRGILIRIIISNCILMYSKEVKEFQKLGIVIKFQSDSESSYMHNKFCIVDSKWLIHGSMNWTRQATFDNWENVLITNSEYLVKQFSEGFEKLWLTFS